MITLERIKNGLKNGAVKLVDEHTHGSVMCRIGDNFFYFGGQEAEDMTAEDYLKYVGTDCIALEIYETLDDFRDDEYFDDEYKYYDYYLEEHGV